MEDEKRNIEDEKRNIEEFDALMQKYAKKNPNVNEEVLSWKDFSYLLEKDVSTFIDSYHVNLKDTAALRRLHEVAHPGLSSPCNSFCTDLCLYVVKVLLFYSILLFCFACPAVLNSRCCQCRRSRYKNLGFCCCCSSFILPCALCWANGCCFAFGWRLLSSMARSRFRSACWWRWTSCLSVAAAAAPLPAAGLPCRLPARAVESISTII